MPSKIKVILSFPNCLDGLTVQSLLSIIQSSSGLDLIKYNIYKTIINVENMFDSCTFNNMLLYFFCLIAGDKIKG
jgi:hypothetical protein